MPFFQDPPKRENLYRDDDTLQRYLRQHLPPELHADIEPELEALGISAADWARLKGNLRSGGTTQGGDDLPAEYRDLVGRYFQVIAREAGRSE